jgi:hypothetical protein
VAESTSINAAAFLSLKIPNPSPLPHIQPVSAKFGLLAVEKPVPPTSVTLLISSNSSQQKIKWK